MSKTEGPQTQVRGSVGDAAQTVLYGMDGLVHEHIGCIKLLFKTIKKTKTDRTDYCIWVKTIDNTADTDIWHLNDNKSNLNLSVAVILLVKVQAH